MTEIDDILSGRWFAQEEARKRLEAELRKTERHRKLARWGLVVSIGWLIFSIVMFLLALMDP